MKAVREGVTQTEAARVFGGARPTVTKWATAYETAGAPALKAKRRGRPRADRTGRTADRVDGPAHHRPVSRSAPLDVVRELRERGREHGEPGTGRDGSPRDAWPLGGRRPARGASCRRRHAPALARRWPARSRHGNLSCRLMPHRGFLFISGFRLHSRCADCQGKRGQPFLPSGCRHVFQRSFWSRGRPDSSVPRCVVFFMRMVGGSMGLTITSAPCSLALWEILGGTRPGFSGNYQGLNITNWTSGIAPGSWPWCGRYARPW